MEIMHRTLDGAPLPDIKACGLCSHIHMGRCKEYAPNAQFSCACPGECPHGRHPAYCSKCNEPEIKACSHLQSGTFTSLPVKEHQACANCGTHICSDCQDDAVHCHSRGSTCLGIICEDCLETARKRDIKRPMFDGKRNAQIPTTDYLCIPCCAKQDTARKELGMSITDLMCLTLFTSGDGLGQYWPSRIWLDEIIDKLETALEKVKEAL
jgi:hypothetical protein